MTAHRLLPEVPEPLRARVVSLLDLVIDEIRGTSGRYVLLATHGTRLARIFECHPRWDEVAGRVRFLDEKDQHCLHESVYRLKQNVPVEPLISWLESLPGNTASKVSSSAAPSFTSSTARSRAATVVGRCCTSSILSSQQLETSTSYSRTRLLLAERLPHRRPSPDRAPAKRSREGRGVSAGRTHS